MTVYILYYVHAGCYCCKLLWSEKLKLLCRDRVNEACMVILHQVQQVA